MTAHEVPKRNKRVELGDRSKEAILDAAARLMSEHGYDGTSISMIAKESGLPASSIYWHFSSKLGILTAVIERDGTRFRERTLLVGLSAGTRLDRLQELFERAADAVEANPEFVRLQMMIMLNSPAGMAKEAIVEARSQQREDIRAALVTALTDLGATRASTIAEELMEFVASSFEGILLATQGISAETRPLLRQLAKATAALAEVYASDPHIVGKARAPTC